MKYILLTGLLMLGANTGCSKNDAPAAPQPSTAPPTAAPAEGFAGKVVETMDASDYTYVLVDTGKEKKWAAAPKFTVKVGDTASIAAAMPMPNYHSKTLDRDFEVVYFTASVSVNGALPDTTGLMSQLPKDHPPVGAGAQMPELPKDHPPVGAAAAKPTVDLSGIQRAEGGKTVAEVYAEKSELAGKETKVRGKVVKFNPMIMGKNWIHLRDGTGQEGSNDLLVTSTVDTKVGDTIIATGLVSVNKDFGANYKYSVMIEDAKVTVE